MLSVRGSRESRLAEELNAMLLINVFAYACIAYTNKLAG
jgi:hypothetical protein